MVKVYQLMRTSHRNTAQIQGMTVLDQRMDTVFSPLVIQVRQVEKLGRKKVTFFSRIYRPNFVLVVTKSR